MPTIGCTVRVLEPFAQAFPDLYTVRAIEGTTAFLDGVPEGMADAFDIAFLEVVA